MAGTGIVNVSLPKDADGNSVPFEGGFIVKKSITFAGGTTNAIGDHDGTGDPFDIFTVTGLVKARIFGFCTTTLVDTTDTATLEVGTAKSTAAIIAQTTGTDIDVNEIWHDNAPDNSVELLTVAPEEIIGQDVIGTVGTANITAGVIDFYAIWYPLSPDGNLVAA